MRQLWPTRSPAVLLYSLIGFEDGDRIELQFLNSSGRVEVTTRGVTVGTYPGTPEIYSAIESGEVKDYVGRDVVTGERIMAASSLLKFNGQVVGVMRYVTAIGNIDRQVLLTVLLVAGVMVAVVGLIVLSSMIFINNVVAIGVGVGIFTAHMIGEINHWPIMIEVSSALYSFLFSAFVGMFFGFYPAYRASKLNPIDCLRYE